MSGSADQFERSKEDIHRRIKEYAQLLAASGPSVSKDQSKKYAEEFITACKSLNSLLVPADRPGWVKIGLPLANRFVGGNDTDEKAFFEWLYLNGDDIRRPIVISPEGAVSFDDIYSETRDSLNLPELFDKMVDAVGRIIALDVIESKTVSDALEKLRVTLKSNRKGSQGAVFAAFNYAKFVKLLLKGYAKKYGGVPFEAYDACVQEAEAKVEEVRQEYEKRTIEEFVDPKSLLRFIASGEVENEGLEEALPAGFLEAPDDPDEEDEIETNEDDAE